LDVHRAAGARRADEMALTDTVRVEVAASRRDAALATYTARPEVLYAEPDYAVHAFYTPNDPRFDDQWSLQKIRAQQAWDVTRGTSGIKVAVADCGVFSQQTNRNASDGQDGHPDLRGRVSLNRDFTGSSTGFDDYCNHGTHVAGIIAAAGNNGIGISGLAPNVSLINAKVLGDEGSGSTSNIVNGVVWAVQNGARVVNLSLGRDGPCSQAERDTMSYAWSQGTVVVAAAGNSALNASGAPANCENVIAVASTTSSDARAPSSNYGANVDVAAPGTGILSTVRSGGYADMGGTSMASPHVAALAALLFAQTPSASAQTVVDRIRTSSDRVSGTGSLWAWGRINAAAALNAGGPPPTATPTMTPTAVPVPTRVACPSPRPQIRLTTTATSATTMAVSVRAGAGVVREINFRELRNATISIGSQSNVGNPFIFRPGTYASQQPFTVNRPNASQSTTVSLTIPDDCGPWSTFVGVGPGGAQRGTVSGTVRNASNQQPISGATVTVRDTQRTATTNSNGVYTIAEVPAGSQTVEVTKSGFASGTVQVNVESGQNVTANVSLAPSGGSTAEIRVALTWGDNPDDMDIHMSGPTSGSQRFHLYWNDRDAAPHATLSQDDSNGNGPESVTIRRNPSTGAWVPGEYRVWAHNYSGTPNFGQSSARVTVTRGGQTLGVYNVGDASGNPSQSLWRSVNVTVDANGNVSLSAANQFVSGGSSSVLSMPDGPGGPVSWPAGGKP
jgi:thermitase